ncbi:hypothetical protein [Dickeya sp. NCPPB 3274]|uniref:hypothetical protein n=1 Tax=Dickeya sp. NCPPB 3274 TaxID=568766 RepID=UPI00039F0A4D|nr:hypothetical protein [Dickeya sp. NCPPB 3274]
MAPSAHPLLITGHPFEWLTIPGLGRIACTFIRHQPSLMLVSAGALSQSGLLEDALSQPVWETVRIFGAAALSRYIGENAQHSQLVVIDSLSDDAACALGFAILDREGWQRHVAASTERVIRQAVLQPDTIACDHLPTSVNAAFSLVHRYPPHG